MSKGPWIPRPPRPSQCLTHIFLGSPAVFLPLIVLFYFVRTRYIVCSREVKRWEAVSRSPVYAFFAQSIKGLPTIRSFGATEVLGNKGPAGHPFGHTFMNLLPLLSSPLSPPTSPPPVQRFHREFLTLLSLNNSWCL